VASLKEQSSNQGITVLVISTQNRLIKEGKGGFFGSEIAGHSAKSGPVQIDGCE